jgi:hypothetical protein
MDPLLGYGLIIAIFLLLGRWRVQKGWIVVISQQDGTFYYLRGYDAVGEVSIPFRPGRRLERVKLDQLCYVQAWSKLDGTPFLVDVLVRYRLCPQSLPIRFPHTLEEFFGDLVAKNIQDGMASILDGYATSSEVKASEPELEKKLAEFLAFRLTFHRLEILEVIVEATQPEEITLTEQAV